MTAAAFSDPASRRWGRWIGAAVAVTTVHATALALAIVGFEPEEIVEEPEGSVMMELAPLPVSASPDAINMPPTPVETAALSMPKTLEAVQPEEELPEVEPSPLAPDPEVAVPILKPVEEVKETEEPEPETPTPDDPAPAEMAAPQVATPPPTLAATPSPTTAARKQGTTAEAAREEASWQKRIVTQLGKHRRYPAEARARREQGDTLVRFTVDREGRVVFAMVVESSGSSRLDAEALDVLTRASPLPAPPDELEGATFDLELPIRFRIRGN